MNPRRMGMAMALLLTAGPAPGAPGDEAGGPEWRARGSLDLALVSSLEGRELNRFTHGDSNFDPYRLRLFLDARIAPGLELHAQTWLHEGAWGLRADGAYLLWSPWAGRDLAFEAGKIPWPIGAWAPRSYSDRNWLMGTPLLYQYRTALPWHELPATTDDLVANAGVAQLDRDLPFLPLVDDRWWDVGAAFLGSLPPWEFSAGVVQGSPSWPAPGADDTPGHTVLGRVGLAPLSGLRFGVSGADGTYLPEFVGFALPAGREPLDYHETTVMADAEFARGPFEIRGEAARRRWETAYTGALEVDAGYAEARWTHGSGAWLALRAEAMRFSDVTTSTSAARPWDAPVDRFEGVAGYRVSREVRVKLGLQRTVRHPHGAARLRTDLLFAGVGVQF